MKKKIGRPKPTMIPSPRSQGVSASEQPQQRRQLVDARSVGRVMFADSHANNLGE